MYPVPLCPLEQFWECPVTNTAPSQIDIPHSTPLHDNLILYARVSGKIHTVLRDRTDLGNVQLAVLQSGQVAKGVLGQELGCLPVGRHGERGIVRELGTGEGGSGEHLAAAGVACAISMQVKSAKSFAVPSSKGSRVMPGRSEGEKGRRGMVQAKGRTGRGNESGSHF